MYQVLIVDDEPIVKIALRSMLDWGSLGFHICGTASNGQEALEMAERMHPDLIICDLNIADLESQRDNLKMAVCFQLLRQITTAIYYNLVIHVLPTVLPNYCM